MTRGIVNSADLDDDWLHSHLYGGASRVYDIALLDWLDEDEDRDSADSPEFTSGAVYFGDWITHNGYPQRPNMLGPNRFAAIYSRTSHTITVAWSQWFQQGLFDWLSNDAYLLHANGDSTTYSLPPEAFCEQALNEWGGEITEAA